MARRLRPRASRSPSRRVRVFDGLALEVERGRVPRAARALGLRQVHPAQRHRRPARRRGRADLDRRAQRHLGGAQGPRHRHGLPVLRALPAHDACAQNLSFGLRMARTPARRDRAAGRAGGRHAADRATCSTAGRTSSRAASASASRSAGRWCATPTCSCSTSRSRTSTPSCAPRCGSRSSGCTSGSADDDDLRHPRPDRGDDAGRPHRGHEGPAIQQLGTPARDLPPAGQPLRRRLRRLAAHELRRRPARAGGRRPGLRRRRTAGCRSPATSSRAAGGRAAGRRWASGPSTSPRRRRGRRRRWPASRSTSSSRWGPTTSSGAAIAGASGRASACRRERPIAGRRAPAVRLSAASASPCSTPTDGERL